MVINLKNKSWIILIIIIIAVTIGTICYFFVNSKKDKTPNYESKKTSINETNDNNLTVTSKSSSSREFKEEEISSFSTNIYNKDSARQNNIEITCSILNNTIIDNNSIFSFCDTVGKATTERGYQESDIFDKEGNKIKGLGGGNCQVSTTLYNAVLNIPSLVIVERHEHSNYVPYIEKGKDAAVAYGSYDLKFQNNSGNKIKIKAETDSSLVTIKLFKMY